MSYRQDKDLEFLGKCDNEDLGELFKLLTYDPKDNLKRLTETLFISDEFKQYGHDYKKYWKRIAEELQLFGGNTISNVFRGGSGVLYREILEDVARNQKISFKKSNTTTHIEDKLVSKVMENYYDSLSKEEQRKFIDDLGESGKDFKKIFSSDKFINNSMINIITTTLVSIVFSPWILVYIARPAMRITLPAVFLIAVLRKKIENNKN